MRLPAAIVWFLTCLALGGGLKTESLDLEKFPEGDPPSSIFVVAGAMQIKLHAGEKVLEISGAHPETDAGAVFGPSSRGAAVIEAGILASKSGRSFPRFGIGVLGQTGFRLYVVPARKELQLLKNDELIRAVPFDWKSESKTKLRLEIVPGGTDRWIIKGKSWPSDEKEPNTFQITHDFRGAPGSGQCSIWGTPYAGTPIEFGAIKVGTEG